MICEEEKSTVLCPIARLRKEILGVPTEYQLEFIKDGEYRIAVVRDGERGEAKVKGDFFHVTDIFKTVVETDTLPENMEYIESDFELV